MCTQHSNLANEMNDFGAPPTTDFDVDITATDVAFFRTNGFLSVARITTDEELAWLRNIYDQLAVRPLTGFPNDLFDLAQPYGTRGEGRLPQLLMPERRVPQLRDTALYKNARRIAVRLLDVASDVVEHWGHLIYKPALHGAVTPWHQDEGYWDPRRSYHAVGAWTPLDDADVDNGCLWFVPGSHRGAVHRHRHIGGDPATHGLELDEAADVSTGVPVPLLAGGVSFHHPRTLHYAGPNRTMRQRRAWANEFQTAPTRVEAPDDRPWVNEGNAALAEAIKQTDSQRSDSVAVDHIANRPTSL